MIRLSFFALLFTSFLLATTFKIASYNVENLFDLQCNGTEYAEYLPYQHHWNQKMLRTKLTNISEVICEVDADIIGLQEIENDNALKLLQQSLKGYGCTYPYRAITHKPKSAIQVAILSKVPIEWSRDIVVTRAWGIRNILEVRFEIEGEPLTVFVNHWNSKQSPNSKRLRSAVALRKRLSSLPRGSEYIVLGDFNLHYNEEIMHSPLNTVRERKMDDNALYNLWFEEPIYRRWSHNFYGKKQSLDMILIPKSMLDTQGINYIKDSFHVFKRSYLFHKKGYILRWQYHKGQHRGVGYSDHLPIVAKFATQPYPQKVFNTSLATVKQLHQNRLSLPSMVQNVKVIEKTKRKAIIEQNGSTIAIYGMDQVLSVGEWYDLVVFKRQLYQGAYEIVDFEIEKRYDTNKKRS